MQKTKLSDFVPDSSNRVWIAGQNKDFKYSDGDAVEKRLYEAVRAAKNVDVFSPELVGGINDWPSEYHFSPRRANILRILQNLNAATRVLELGCGCGAITKALAEKGCRVDAVEGSFRRASVAAERVRDHKQARIHVANFQDVDFEPVYDVVTLIGVLEYAPVYLDAQDPFRAALEMAASALKPGGILVVAIENKLGLKYFSGITEDHFSIAYYGIEGRYGKREITTYGKRQLAEKLQQSGFSTLDFYYPFPDYKLPEVVLSDRALNTPGFNAADLVGSLENRDYSGKGKETFRLHLTWDSVADEGLLGELSNSFLVLASRSQQTSQIDQNIIAQKYTDNRIPGLNCITNFITQAQSIQVRKERLTNDELPSTKLLEHSIPEENYVPGQNLLVGMQRSLSRNNKAEFLKLLNAWRTALYTAHSNKKLDKNWVDAIPSNFILSHDGKTHFIDREWHAKFEINLELLIHRGIISLFTNTIIYPLIPGDDLETKVRHVCSEAGIDFSLSSFQTASALNVSLWQDIYAGGIWNTLRYRYQKALQQEAAKQTGQFEGIPGVKQRAIPVTNPYPDWLAARQLKFAELERLTAAVPVANIQFTIVINATEASPEELGATFDSFAAQQHPAIQLVVASPLPSPIEDTGAIVWLQTPALSEQQLQELTQTSPDNWLCLVRAGDQVTQSGLLLLAQHLLVTPQASMAYVDEDVLNAKNEIESPAFKPDFDLDLLRCTPYIGRFLFMRGKAFTELGGLNPSSGLAGFQDYAFRFYERFGKQAITHLPEIVFHANRESAVDIEALREVLTAHLSRSQIAATVTDGLLPGSFRVQYSHEQKPLVSIIIPTKNQQAMLCRCIETLTEKTSYPHYEILIVDNESTEPDAKAYLQGIIDLNLPQLRVIPFNKPFNFSAMNNLAAREAQGEYLVLLNNDTAIIKNDWLDALLNHALRPEVGIVGAKLLYPDGKIQHAGVILGLRGPADHPFIGAAIDELGYAGRLQLDQQYSAVTAACLIIRKSVYEAVGGMDEEAFKVSYNDVDLCIKTRESGLSIVWTPHALVMHVGNISQKSEDKAKQEAKIKRFEAEKQAIYQKWMPALTCDPAYNRNFRLSGKGFELESNLVFRPALPGQKKLLAHCADLFGSGMYRVVSPATTLVENGLVAGGCFADYFDPVEAARIEPDAIVLQRQINHEQFARIENYQKYTRAKLIFELDDYLPNLPLASIHKSQVPKDVTRRLRQGVEMCDRIVVSTVPLKEALSNFHPEIAVLPNYLPHTLWGNIPVRDAPVPGRKPRVGWAGGSSHTGDLRVIADVVRALADQVDWVFFGMHPEGLEACIKEFHPGVHIGEYPQKLAELNLDLALAPLEENIFNECKSNLRLLEYGICGYPVIATDLAPYRCGFPVSLVRNRFKDWVDTIQAKLEDRNALWKEGVALQRFVREGWMLEGGNLLRWRDGWMLGN